MCYSVDTLRGAMNSLHSKAVHEHDVVPEGSVDIQVDLLNFCGEVPSLLLHFLENKKNDRSVCYNQSTVSQNPKS